MKGLPRELIHCNDTEQTITVIPNGAIISFKSGEKPDNLFGEDVWAAVMEDSPVGMTVMVLHAVCATLTATHTGLSDQAGTIQSAPTL